MSTTVTTVSNDFLAKMPILDDCRAIVELEAASGFLKTLLRASSVADDSSEIQGAVQKLLVENEHVRLLLAQHGLNYERLRTSLCDKQVYIAIGNDAARQDVYCQCLDSMQNGSIILSKAWVSLLEPDRQLWYRYSGANTAVPPWWPSTTGPYKIDYKNPSRMDRCERIVLLIHIMGVIVNQDPNGRAAFLSLDVARLEEATREAMTFWFADKKNSKNAEKRGFLTQLFRVLYMEERYRRGELGASATVCVDLDDSESTVTNNRELSQNQGDLSDDLDCQQLNQPGTRGNELPRKSEEGANNKQADPSTYSLSQLSVREAERSEYKNDETGLFPWQISKLSVVVDVRGHKYYRQEVLVPESDLHDNNTGIYDEPEPSVEEYDFWGEGLYSKKGKWYGINEDEVRSLTVIGEDEVWNGDDGQKYRKSIRGLHGLFVGLKREVVVIDNVRHVAHLVLTLRILSHTTC